MLCVCMCVYVRVSVLFLTGASICLPRQCRIGGCAHVHAVFQAFCCQTRFSVFFFFACSHAHAFVLLYLLEMENNLLETRLKWDVFKHLPSPISYISRDLCVHRLPSYVGWKVSASSQKGGQMKFFLLTVTTVTLPSLAKDHSLRQRAFLSDMRHAFSNTVDGTVDSSKP